MTPAFKETWDYLGYSDMSPIFAPYLQKDWNQTLITMINQVSSQIHQANKSGGANKIIINEELLPLIESFEYYHPSAKAISGRYKVIIDNDIPSNKIYLFHKYELNTMGEITILNFPVPRKTYIVVVGQQTPEEIKEVTNGLMERFKDKVIVDRKTGEFNLNYNEVDIDTDYFIPAPTDIKIGNYFTPSVDTTKHKPTFWQRLKKLFKND